MKETQMLIPSPEHPISITQSSSRLVVRVAGRVIADTTRALALKEATYPVVLYVPREDVDMSLLTRTENLTFCPYKGECNYYSIGLGGEKSENAVWTYENPFPAVAEIKDHLAFYSSRVDEFIETTTVEGS